MKYKGSEFKVLKNDDGINFSAEPNIEELNSLVWAVMNWRLDDQVTHALRKIGFGGDGFGVSFPDDVNDDWEYEQEGIRLDQNQVLVDIGFDNEYFIIDEMLYFECLKQMLMLNGLTERAQTIDKYMKAPNYAKQLDETNVDFCKRRFFELSKILIKEGWKINNDSNLNKYLYLEGATSKLYFENTSQDMNVFLREMENSLKNHIARPQTEDVLKYSKGLKSLIKAVKLLFESEKHR